jgi:hypothetical protein
LSEALRYALSYATRLGWPIFPLVPRTKRPLTHNGFKSATTDEDRIRHWWTQTPDAGIGCPIPPGYLVLDLDTEDALHRLRAMDFDVPATAHALTARGHHFWFTNPDGDFFGAQRRVFEVGDVKGQNGYVVLPPSVHPTGVIYEWDTPPRDKATQNLNICEAPEWLLAELHRQAEAGVSAEAPNLAGSGNASSIFVSGVQEGSRNREVFRYASRLRGVGLNFEEAKSLVLDLAARCTPPLDKGEAIVCLQSAWRRYDPNPDRPEEQAVAVETEIGGMISDEDFGITDVSTILDANYPAINWLVPGLIAEGLTVLYSSPKIGKSWASFNLSAAVACGGSVLGKFRASQAEVLYLDLEQPDRKTQSRLRAIPGMPRHGIKFAHEWERHDKGGFDKLDRLLKLRPSVKLVVIDVLNKVIGKKPQGGNAYEVEYEIYSWLQQIFSGNGVAGVALHHDNKSLSSDPFDKMSGSRALFGVADTVLHLSRKRGTQEGELSATGREIEDRVMKVRFDPIVRSWVVIDDPADAAPHMSGGYVRTPYNDGPDDDYEEEVPV